MSVINKEPKNAVGYFEFKYLKQNKVFIIFNKYKVEANHYLNLINYLI